MLSRITGLLAAVVLSSLVVQAQQVQAQNVDMSGAWDVTIKMSGGSMSGLAVLSQDGSEITGMLGPDLTDMFPVEGKWDGSTLTILARPRTGRTTAFAKCELTGTRERMTGTIDSGKGTIEFDRKHRAANR
jgi:hypothetical protein